MDGYYFYMVLPVLLSNPVKAMVTFAQSTWVYPPMFGIAAGLAYALFGVSPFVARATSAFFGLMTLVGVYLIGSMISGRRTALSAVVLLASTPIFFLVSSLAFHITIGLAFGLGGLYFYLLASQKDRVELYTLAGLLEAFSILSNYIMLPIYALILLHLLAFRGGKVSRILALGLPFLAVIPWAYYTLIVLGRLNTWTTAMNATVDVYKRHVWSDPSAWYWYAVLLPQQIGVLQSFIVLAGLAYTIVRPTIQRSFLLLWVLSVYLTFVLIPNKDLRYTISYIPALTLMASRAVRSFSSYVGRSLARFKINASIIRSSIFVAIIIILAVSSIASQSLGSAHGANVAIESAAQYMAERLRHGESVVVLLCSNSSNPPFLEFELARLGKMNNVWTYPSLPIDIGRSLSINTRQFFSLANQSNTRFGLLWVGSHNPLVVSLANNLSGDPHILSTRSFGNGTSEVLVYEFIQAH
jgi:4-amino-4-deoxy-L-arabinose transferase-like glycosyltransferase